MVDQVQTVSPVAAPLVPTHRSRTAFLTAVPIGLLGGLIGLGGAEFRLPVLAGPLRYSARQAVPLNLAVSLITLAASLAIRSHTLSLAPVEPFAPGVLAIVAGAVLAAFLGPGLAGRLSDARLERVIFVLLVAIGTALIIEGFVPQTLPGLLPAGAGWQVGAGLLFGLAIGLVSSLLGVAGGELIIPTLVFAYGADITTAGTASLLISLPTVAVGVVRYARRGAFAGRRPLVETVAPMGVGSVIGAVIGGLLVGIVPLSVLKLGLGLILITSAGRTFRKLHDHGKVPRARSDPTATDIARTAPFRLRWPRPHVDLLDVFLLPGLCFALFVAIPLGALVYRALQSGNLLDSLHKPIVREALRLSFTTSTISITVIVLFGTPLAYLLARSHFPGKRLVDTLIDLPMVLPPVVAGVALLMAFGRRGVLGPTLENVGLELAFSTKAVVLAEIFVSAPFYIRATKVGFQGVDPLLEQIAYTLGASRFTTFRRISLPLAMPAILGGLVLAWARALSEFGATMMFAGNFRGTTQTMPLAIMTAMESDLFAALSISVILLGVSFTVLLLFRVVTRGGPA